MMNASSMNNAPSRDAPLAMAECSYLEAPMANHKIENLHPDLQPI